jgi:hypothetical protein
VFLFLGLVWVSIKACLAASASGVLRQWFNWHLLPS